VYLKVILLGTSQCRNAKLYIMIWGACCPETPGSFSFLALQESSNMFLRNTHNVHHFGTSTQTVEIHVKSRDNSVDILTGYEMDDRNSIPGRGISLFHSVQTYSGADTTFYTFRLGGRAAGALS
jgi:hypothetical protein